MNSNHNDTTAKPKMRRSWTRQQVKSAIHRMGQDGLPLTYESTERESPGIYEAARVHYGSWREAVAISWDGARQARIAIVVRNGRAP